MGTLVQLHSYDPDGLVLDRAIERAAKDGLTAVYVSPGRYKVASSETRGMRKVTWYRLTAHRRWDAKVRKYRIVVTCDCPQADPTKGNRHDDFGNSVCKHSIALCKRLIKRRPEAEGLPVG